MNGRLGKDRFAEHRLLNHCELKNVVACATRAGVVPGFLDLLVSVICCEGFALMGVLYAGAYDAVGMSRDVQD